VIEDGVTGFIVDDEEEAVAAIRRLGEIDRRKVRARFEERFTSSRMARDYVGLYEGLREQPVSRLLSNTQRTSRPASR